MRGPQSPCVEGPEESLLLGVQVLRVGQGGLPVDLVSALHGGSGLGEFPHGVVSLGLRENGCDDSPRLQHDIHYGPVL
eukprot:275099-Alexandrium_andersonii.AAC.1